MQSFYGCTGVFGRETDSPFIVWHPVIKLLNYLPPLHSHTLAPLFALFLSTHCSSTPSHKSLDKWAAHRCCRSAPPLLPAASDLYSMGMGAMCLLFTAACVNVNLTLLRPPQLSRTLCHSTSENPLALAQGLCTEIVCWELESRSLEVKIT